MLQLHLPRHQKRKDFQVRCRLLLAHLLDGVWSVALEVGSEGEQEILVERSTCSLQGPARVSRPPRSEFAVDALGDVVRIGLGVQGHRGVLCLLRAWRVTDWGVI